MYVEKPSITYRKCLEYQPSRDATVVRTSYAQGYAWKASKLPEEATIVPIPRYDPKKPRSINWMLIMGGCNNVPYTQVEQPRPE